MFYHKNTCMLNVLRIGGLFFFIWLCSNCQFVQEIQIFLEKNYNFPVKCDRLLGSRFTWKQCCRLCCCSWYIQEQQIKKSSIAVLDFYAVVATWFFSKPYNMQNLFVTYTLQNLTKFRMFSLIHCKYIRIITK